MACLVDSHADQTKQGLPMERKRGAAREAKRDVGGGGGDDDGRQLDVRQSRWVGSVELSTGSRSSSSLLVVALVKPSPNSVAKREPHEKAIAVDGCEL